MFFFFIQGKILDDAQPLTKYKIQPNGFVVVMVRKSRAPPPKPAATQVSSLTAVKSKLWLWGFY